MQTLVYLFTNTCIKLNKMDYFFLESSTESPSGFIRGKKATGYVSKNFNLLVTFVSPSLSPKTELGKAMH